METKGTTTKAKWTYAAAAAAMTLLVVAVLLFMALNGVKADSTKRMQKSIDQPKAQPMTYTDVDPAGAQADEIGAATAAGYVIGVGNDLYEPDRTPTRGEVAVVLTRCAHGPDFYPPEITAPTPDHPYAHWAAEWLAQAVADGTMEPVAMVMADEPATRGDLAALVAVCRLGN